MIFLHSKNFSGWLQQPRSAWTGGGAAPTMQNTSSEPPSKEGWAQAAPYGPSVLGQEGVKPLTRQIPTSCSPQAANLHSWRLFPLGCVSRLIPELPQESWLLPVARLRTLLCKKSVGCACPAPHLSPHVTGDPSSGVCPRGNLAPLRVGQLGTGPSAPQGLLPHCVRRDHKSSQEPQPGPAVSWETVCSEDWIYEMLSVSQPSLRNTKQKTTFRYISEENTKHLVPFAGVHSKRKVGSTFAYHKRESYAEKKPH